MVHNTGKAETLTCRELEPAKNWQNNKKNGCQFMFRNTFDLTDHMNSDSADV